MALNSKKCYKHDPLCQPCTMLALDAWCWQQVHANLSTSTAEVNSDCSPGEVQRYQSFARFCLSTWRLSGHHFTFPIHHFDTTTFATTNNDRPTGPRISGDPITSLAIPHLAEHDWSPFWAWQRALLTTQNTVALHISTQISEMLADLTSKRTGCKSARVLDCSESTVDVTWQLPPFRPWTKQDAIRRRRSLNLSKRFKVSGACTKSGWDKA